MKTLIVAYTLAIAFVLAQPVESTAQPQQQSQPQQQAQTPKGMPLPPQTQAAVLAATITAQTTTLLTNAVQVIDNGIPQQQEQPAVAAKDIQAALGPDNIMRIRTALKVLTDPASAQSPPPKK